MKRIEAMKKPFLFSLGMTLLSGAGLAANTISVPKRTLNANRTLDYNTVPACVEKPEEIFTRGEWYGRLRLNSFRWDWKKGDDVRQDNWAIGMGASLMLKSACFHGFSATIDAYSSQNPWHMDAEKIPYLKAGKDVLSRHDVLEKDRYHMNVIAQLYGEYRISESSVRYGRQKFESFLTRSNDTKMIPNTFEGLTLVSKDLPGHLFKIGWFTKQKLRDHTQFHDVLTYGKNSFENLSGEDNLINAFGNNDDSAMHRGLSYDNYKKAGKSTKHDLLVAEVWSMAVPRLKAMLNFTAVPDVLSSFTAQGDYTVNMGSFKLVAGIRYMRQFDNGGGSIGGANLMGLIGPYGKANGENGGYDDPYSLDGWLIAGRLDIKSEAPWKFRVGYSHIGDEADIVAPWRGFPTGGFTRAMGQYNWQANTDTWMIRGDYDFEKADLVRGLSLMLRYAWQDYDEGKFVVIEGNRVPLTPTDRQVMHLDAIYKIPYLPGLEARVRMGFVDADKSIAGADPSYSEYRFEMNYLF
ncbi:OprD family outer membrane porin [Hydrogenimonas urashimensis]|uniref:OprD family outer membrane porin n=1 Tax=Hydrogenimonas urashimensis TaxID=2740515 RepID=UPI0019164E52|nr:OprD family outer membrane porin [Hydrogenimonas urashimensis]